MEFRRNLRRKLRDPRYYKKVKDTIFGSISFVIILVIFILVFRMMTR